MGSPSTALATQRPDIADSLEQFDLQMDRNGFIGYQVLPVIDVGAQSGKYGKIPLEQLLQERNTARTSEGGYSRSKFTFTDAGYTTEEHGAEEIVDQRQAQIYASYFNHEVISAQRALDAVLRNAERRVAAKVFNATTWTGSSLTTAVATEWSTVATAAPITDVDGAVNKVWDGSGLWPNALIINRKVFRNLRNCVQIIERIQSNGAGNPTKASDVTTAMLAAVFDLDYVLVAGAARNSAAEGQTRSLSQIWSSEYAMVCRIATSSDMREPCIGRTAHWSEDGSTIGGTVETYPDPSVRGDVIRVRHEVAEIIIYPESAHLLSNITA